MEAIEMTLTGNQKNNYDIYYRVHVQDLGWLGWAKNGETAGTMNYALKIEAVQILIVPKDTPAIENGQSSFKKKNTIVEYSTHVENIREKLSIKVIFKILAGKIMCQMVL